MYAVSHMRIPVTRLNFGSGNLLLGTARKRPAFKCLDIRSGKNLRTFLMCG